MPTDQAHPFDAAVQLEAVGDRVMRGRTTAPYANQVGPFGGVTAAAVLRTIQEQEDVLGDPVALTVNFLAGVGAGAFDIVPRPVRTNRSTQHWYVEVVQDDDVVATATAVTGVHRETWSDTEAVPPSIPAPAEIERGGKTHMEWPNRYEIRFLTGDMDLSGAENDSSESVLWVRDDPPRPLDFASLTAMCDSFFARVYIRLARPIPIGTVSMTIYFHASADELAQHGDDYLLGVARGARFDRGFCDQSAQLWGRGEKLLASSHQILYYKG